MRFSDLVAHKLHTLSGYSRAQVELQNEWNQLPDDKMLTKKDIEFLHEKLDMILNVGCNREHADLSYMQDEYDTFCNKISNRFKNRIKNFYRRIRGRM